MAAVAAAAPASGHYHATINSIGRGTGAAPVVAKAAYRSGECLFDERTQQWFDYRHKADRVIESYILLPDGAAAWGHDRSRLWNASEAAEPRKNGRNATELEIALPHALTDEQRHDMLSAFVQQKVATYGVAADVAVHFGRDGNIHAHVMLSHREFGPDGFGEVSNARTVTKKRAGQWKKETVYGLAANPDAVKELRREWADFQNAYFERLGLDIRVDHRSFDERGIKATPTIHLGPNAAALEARGIRTDRGDINRMIEVGNAEVRRLEAKKAQHDAEIIDLQAVKAAREAAGAGQGKRTDIPPKDRPMSDDQRKPDGREDFSKAQFEATEPDAGLREAWRQPAFSEASIAADPWTAVYLPIPENADARLLLKGVDAAVECQTMIDRPGTGPRLQQGDDGPTENAPRAAERIRELSHQLARLEQILDDRMERAERLSEVAEQGAPTANQNNPDRVAVVASQEAVQLPEPRTEPDPYARYDHRPLIRQGEPAGEIGRDFRAAKEPLTQAAPEAVQRPGPIEAQQELTAPEAVATAKADNFRVLPPEQARETFEAWAAAQQPAATNQNNPERIAVVASQAAVQGPAPEEAAPSAPAAGTPPTTERQRGPDAGISPDLEREFLADAGAAVDRAVGFASRFLSGLEARVVAVFEFLHDIISPAPPPTAQQVHDHLQAAGNLETIHARDVAAATQETEAARDWQALIPT